MFDHSKIFTGVDDDFCLKTSAVFSFPACFILSRMLHPLKISPLTGDNLIGTKRDFRLVSAIAIKLKQLMRKRSSPSGVSLAL